MKRGENWNEVLAKLRRRLTEPLPGALAHEPMRAVPTGTLIPRFEHMQPPQPCSVLILLYEDVNDLRFPLIQRPDYAGTHSGQISLPGGKAEEGEDAIATALREAWEEVGVPATAVEVLGTLSPFHVIPSNFLVTPVVGFCGYRPVFSPDTIEVVRVLQGNVADLLSDDAVKQKDIVAAKRFPLRAPYFDVEGEIVWGATAMMLNEFRLVLLGLAGRTDSL